MTSGLGPPMLNGADCELSNSEYGVLVYGGRLLQEGHDTILCKQLATCFERAWIICMVGKASTCSPAKQTIDTALYRGRASPF